MRNISNKAAGGVTSILLLVVTLLLVSLAPWGPIENRSFDHLSPAVFWGFNVFLVALGLSSFATVVALWRGRTWAFPGAAVLATLYVLVYVVDLLGVFPQTPDAMSPALLTIEVVDTALAAALVGYCVRHWQAAAGARST